MDDPIQWNIHNNSLLLESTIHPDKLHLSRTSYAMYLYQGIGFFETASSKFREKKTEESSFVFILANIQLEITARNYRKISQQHCDDGKEPTKCDEVVMHVQFGSSCYAGQTTAIVSVVVVVAQAPLCYADMKKDGL